MVCAAEPGRVTGMEDSPHEGVWKGRVETFPKISRCLLFMSTFFKGKMCVNVLYESEEYWTKIYMTMTRTNIKLQQQQKYDNLLN